MNGGVAVSDFYDTGAALTQEERGLPEEFIADNEDGSLKEQGILPKSSFDQ